MTTPDPLRVALLRIFDLAEDRPDIRAVVTAALAAQPTPPLDVERLARAIESADNGPGWDVTADSRESAQLYAAEYARLSEPKS